MLKKVTIEVEDGKKIDPLDVQELLDFLEGHTQYYKAAIVRTMASAYYLLLHEKCNSKEEE